MEKQVDDYVLTMKESDGGQEMIAGTDISLEYVPGEELKKAGKEAGQLFMDQVLVGASEDSGKGRREV